MSVQPFHNIQSYNSLQLKGMCHQKLIDLLKLGFHYKHILVIYLVYFNFCYRTIYIKSKYFHCNISVFTLLTGEHTLG